MSDILTGLNRRVSTTLFDRETSEELSHIVEEAAEFGGDSADVLIELALSEESLYDEDDDSDALSAVAEIDLEDETDDDDDEDSDSDDEISDEEIDSLLDELDDDLVEESEDDEDDSLSLDENTILLL